MVASGGSQKRNRLAWTLLVVATSLLLVAGVAGWYMYRWHSLGVRPPLVERMLPNPELDETDVAESERDKYETAAEYPKYLSIPRLEVDRARIMDVGVNQDNVLESPQNIFDTAWYRNSAKPGGHGAVLVNGHNGGYARDGIFARLVELNEGDVVTVVRGDNTEFTYRVKKVKRLPLEDLNQGGMNEALTVFGDEDEGLNLITCDGTYDARLGQFNERVMVFAVRDELAS